MLTVEMKGMTKRSEANFRQVLILLLFAIAGSALMAANMRSFIEAVRRKAAVVYVGSVKEVQVLARTKFDLKMRAVVEVLTVARGPEKSSREATFEYSSYDERTPMLAGGPQYQLRPGDNVVVFADSFASTIRPGYLLQGRREELLQRITALRDGLSHMSPEQLKTNEINEEDRRIQLELYDKLGAWLRAKEGL